jgi:hypothetical protein
MPARPMPSLTGLLDLVPSNPTASSAPLEHDDTPDVDDSGAGVAHISAEPFPIIGPITHPDPPPPAVTLDNPALPGAPTHVNLGPPTRDLGTGTYTLPAIAGTVLTPLAVVPGSSQHRRVLIAVHLLDPADLPAVYVSPDKRQNTTGARLLPGVLYELFTGAPLFAVNNGADACELSVIIEPIS